MLSGFTLFTGLLPIIGYSALLNLPQTPLILGTPVTPNVFFQLDDSGSMDWEFMMKPYWVACAYDRNDGGTSSGQCGFYSYNDAQMYAYGNNGYRYFSYLNNNNDNVYKQRCASSEYNSMADCAPSVTSEWRAYSSDLNLMYYSPDDTYYPWQGPCSSTSDCTDASFKAAYSNPVVGSSGYSVVTNLSGMKYEVWIDDKGYLGAKPARGASVNVTTGANDTMDLWDSHVTIVLNDTNAKIYTVTYAPNNSSINATTTLVATLTGSACYDVLGPSALVRDIFTNNGSYSRTGGQGCLTLDQAEQNFANWYQYHRRRWLSAKNAITEIIGKYPDFRYGFNTINNTDSVFIQLPPAGTTNLLSYNNTLVSQLLAFPLSAQGTPLRSALERVGKYYANQLSGMSNPITMSCQQNYTILLTDGFWNDGVPSSTIGDVDGDGYSQTLADVARYYYKTDLSTLPNLVVPNSWDPATWQHMVTYTIGFGITGNLTAGDDGWPTPALKVNSNWGDPYASDAGKADDLWHAAFNSAGFFLGAQNPTKATSGLDLFLNNITQRGGSSTPVAQNSNLLTSDSQIYQASYNTNGWYGDLLAYSINTQGVLSTTPNWSAGCLLTGGICQQPVGTNPVIAPTNRVIITRDWAGTNTGIAFRFPTNYTTNKTATNMIAFMTNAPNPVSTTTSAKITANQAYGQALVNYLRGDRSQEMQNNGANKWRDRYSILGDNINSAPLYLGPPNRNYPDNTEALPYSTFKKNNASRTPLVFVGANDGMLHAFNAATGNELLAYIPGDKALYTNLSNLTKPTYTHNFFVDGDLATGDVYTNNAWRSIVVGSLGNGGETVYALDVTNPTQFLESKASSLYLWEFSNADDGDMGFAQGTPIITKVRSGSATKWAVIINNGYNSTSGGTGNGKASLFILFIDQAGLGKWTIDKSYIKIQVGNGTIATPLGLGAAYPVDINKDYVTDYVYAGDQAGNMYRFDLTNTDPTKWKNNTKVLFSAAQTVAGDQPITGAPIVGPHPLGLNYGVMVYFGTGKFLEPIDNNSVGQTTQAFYGIWDKLSTSGTGTVPKSALLQQQILGTVTSTTGSYRGISQNTISWSGTGQNLGWYINLLEMGTTNNFGERVYTQPILRNNNVIFTTLLPSSDPCAYGGSGWLMELNAANGGSPNKTPFDVNNDNTFSVDDYITINKGGKNYTQAPGGFLSNQGTITSPAIFLAPDKSKEYKVISGSLGLRSITENTEASSSNRQSWRQLY